MPGRIRRDDVDAVRERSDLVKIVGGYLQLKKSGRDSLVGLCPFHPEKTPSFSVSPSKQVYYCFGCGEGGDVFRFLSKVENLSFSEAVERLAREAGIAVRYEGESAADRHASGRRQALHRALAEATRLYHRLLLDGREAADARAYIEQRGVSKESVERFQIGYAPGYSDFLLRRMSRAFGGELLIEAGLATKDESGALRDRFRGRLMFPIHDLSGNAIGFGGRLLVAPRSAPPPNAPKYLNSAETPVYHKGSVLYNLNRAKAPITSSGRAFLVEGYTDVVALDQAGVHESVATCGTALGEEHVRLLSRFTDRIVLAFDSDEAGARAAERSFEFHQQYPVEVSVLVLPEGQDPADFVLSRGAEAAEALHALAREAVPLVEYVVRRAVRGFDVTNAEERARAVRAGLEIVANVDDPVRRDDYARVLAELVGASVNSVLLDLQTLLGRSAGVAEAARAATRIPPAQRLEREALRLLVQAPQIAAERAEKIASEHFTKPEYRKAFELIRVEAGSRSDAVRNGPALVAKAQESSEALGRLVAALSLEPLETVAEPTDAYVDSVFLRLEEFALKRRVDDVRRQLERLNPQKASNYDELWDEFARLEGMRRRVRAAQEAL